jgi:peptide/nickel transport system substrate-binding protein
VVNDKEQNINKGGIMKKIFATLSSGLVLLLATTAFADPNFLTIMYDQELYSLEPTTVGGIEDGAAVENVYESLITFDQSGEVVPLLATDWQIAEDGLTYTFTLREGVTFHTGNTMTCQDAQYSIRRQLITNNGDGFASRVSEVTLGFEFWDDEEDTVATIPFSAITEAVFCDEEDRLVMTLLEPDADFLVKLMMFHIVDSTFLVENGDWSGTEDDWQEWINRDMSASVLNTTSAGTNAYQLLSFEPSRSIFQIFEGYWGEGASIQTVVVQGVPDYNTRTLALRNGDADLLFLLRPNFARQLEGEAGVSVDYVPNPIVSMLVFNNPVNSEEIGSGALDGQGIPADFFSDVHVRQGFASAFDAQRVVDEVLLSKGTVVSLPVPSQFGLSTDNPVTFDLARAEEAFRQAWDGQVWEQGFTLDIWYFPSPNGEDVTIQGSLEALKANVESLNPKFRINIVAYSGEDFFELAQGEARAPLFVDFWVGELPSPAHYLDLFYHSERGAYGTFTDETLDALLDQLQTEADPEQRAELISQIGELGQSLVPFITLPEENKALVYRDALQGYLENYNPFRFADVQWSQLSKNE